MGFGGAERADISRGTGMASTKLYGGRWQTLSSLTEGGQSRLYLVRDTTGAYPEDCVLKRVLNPIRAGRFHDEVRAIKTLSHPNIVKLFDHSAIDAPPGDREKQFLVMPHAKAGDLSRAVARYRDAVDDVLLVARQIACALQAAHAAGIIHRDIKPETARGPV
jgi:serine/threonine protein kinase